MSAQVDDREEQPLDGGEDFERDDLNDSDDWELEP
ncbi:MAG: hypothetical protein RL685_5153 [Pseudomonadota bacterium]|jgi:hypothetical protein